MAGIKLRSQLGMTRTQAEARAIDEAKAKAMAPMSGRLSLVTGLAAAIVVGVIAVMALPNLAPLFHAHPAAVTPAHPLTPAELDAREATAAPTGAPLLWKVQTDKAPDSQGKVYLFGSVPVLPGDSDWMDPRLYAAFDNANEAWFETLDLPQDSTVDKSANQTLLTRARLMNKRVDGLESPSAHAAYSDGVDPYVAVTQWRNGDEQAMTAALTREKAKNPREYDRFFARRNTSWLPRLEKMLHGDKTVFVTVGNAHMFGPDGLVAQLRARGYNVTRVDP